VEGGEREGVKDWSF